MIGRSAVRGSARTAEASSKPSMPGISMSVMTTSKRRPRLQQRQRLGGRRRRA